MPEVTYAEAIRLAIKEEMLRNEKCVVIGQGLRDSGIWGTVPLEFDHQLIESPLSEDAMTGFAIGLAEAGWRPILVDIRNDFSLLRMNQLVNIAAKMSMWGDQFKCPLVYRSVIGRSWGQGAQHSQALYSMLCHVPGLRVVAPSCASMAYQHMQHALRMDYPTIMVEHRLLHKTVGSLGKMDIDACVKLPSEILVVGIAHAYSEVMIAAQMLDGEIGISRVPLEILNDVSVLDPFLDIAAKNGNRLLVVDNSWLKCSVSSDILAHVAEHFPGMTVARMGFQHRPCPPHKEGEHEFYPHHSRIASKIWEMVKGEKREFDDSVRVADKAKELMGGGPF